MLISPAYAQGLGGGGSDMFVSLLPLVLIFAVFYFLMIRPQQKKAKQHKEMLSALKRGDRVVTAGGIVGKIVRVEGDNEVLVEIATDVRVRIRQSTISDVMSRSEPAVRDGGDAASEDSGGKKRSGRKPAVRDGGDEASEDSGGKKRGGRKAANN